MLNHFFQKGFNSFNKLATRYYSRKSFNLNLSKPIISFTFDDFPQSAVTHGLELLDKYGSRATYYIAFGLVDKVTPTGKIANLTDIKQVVDSGNFLGCHTFNHLGVLEQKLSSFDKSIERNNIFLQEMFPPLKFNVFSYPKGQVKPGAKKIVENHFICSRGITPGINKGMVDLNLLKGTRIYGNVSNFAWIKNFIEDNVLANGWLIFYTHDISDNPTPYGCTPELFNEVVKYSKSSGALILSVNEVCDLLKFPQVV